jgi:hypothetical protein
MNYKIAKDVVVKAAGSAIRGLFMGLGGCYAFEEKKYSHLPFAVATPMIYSGYQIYKKKYEIRYFIIKTLRG